MNVERCYTIAVLAGDGIGPEVMAEAIKVLDAASRIFGFRLAYRHAPIGGAAIDQFGSPLPDATWKICQEADAVLLGSIGGPRWDNLPREKRPETGGLLSLRRKLKLYANLRPVSLLPELKEMSPLALRQMDREVDILTVRELSSGIYFGEPRSLEEDEAVDTMRYRRDEIARIAHVAFAAARSRRKKVTSVDKANVLACSALWRRTVSDIARSYSDVELNHMYVDNASMQLILNPLQFDVLLTENMFGDILSDESAAIAGSLGLLPSASLGESIHLYEPAGGSAPDIAGFGIANPAAQILSAAMMLEYSFAEKNAAEALSRAVTSAIRKGHRTADIAGGRFRPLSTAEMGDAIAAELTII